jgi:hypothetical protein
VLGLSLLLCSEDAADDLRDLLTAITVSSTYLPALGLRSGAVHSI